MAFKDPQSWNPHPQFGDTWKRLQCTVITANIGSQRKKPAAAGHKVADDPSATWLLASGRPTPLSSFLFFALLLRLRKNPVSFSFRCLRRHRRTWMAAARCAEKCKLEATGKGLAASWAFQGFKEDFRPKMSHCIQPLWRITATLRPD